MAFSVLGVSTSLLHLSDYHMAPLGGTIDDLMDDAQEAGVGGLLDEVSGLFGDAVAEKRSQMEKWRVREAAVVCVQLLASAPNFPSGLAEQLQGTLIQRRALETNDSVTAVLDAGTEQLTNRMLELMKPHSESNAGGRGAQEERLAVTTKTGEEVDHLDAAQTAMALQKEGIAADIARRMAELASLEEEARNETDGVQKAVLLVLARKESIELKKIAQNTADLGSKLNVLLDFADGIKAQLADMDEKLDALGDAVGALHEDIKRLAGRPFLELYSEWASKCVRMARSQLASEVYIEAGVVGPGGKGKFDPDDKDLYDPEKPNSSRPVTEAFKDFMMSTANVLLLSGAAGSGKSTAYSVLMTYVLDEYTKARAKVGVTVILLPVSLPQLKDPLNGIFREGLELAYNRSLRPSHADELRELVQVCCYT